MDFTEVDFTDWRSAEAWYKTLSIEARCAITCRATLRVLGSLAESDASTFDAITIASFRAVLISASRGSGRIGLYDWTKTAESAHSVAYSIANAARSNARSAARSAARTAVTARTNRSEYAAALSTYSPRSTHPQKFIRAAIRFDVEKLASFAGTTQPYLALYAGPVWAEADAPDAVLTNHLKFLDLLAADPKWAFWRDWYLKMWQGDPVNWDFAFEVIKIEDGVWEEGAEAVAEEIERINLRLAVKNVVTSIKQDSRVEIRSRHGVGGNNPPEQIDDPTIRQAITLIWPILDTLEEEVKKSKPDRKVVAAALTGLKKAIAACLGWSARKADLAVDTSIKWAVPIVGTGVVTFYPEKVAGLIKLVESLLKGLQ